MVAQEEGGAQPSEQEGPQGKSSAGSHKSGQASPDSKRSHDESQRVYLNGTLPSLSTFPNLAKWLLHPKSTCAVVSFLSQENPSQQRQQLGSVALQG